MGLISQISPREKKVPLIPDLPGWLLGIFLVFSLFLPLNLFWDVFPQANLKIPENPELIWEKGDQLFKKYSEVLPGFKVSRFFHFDHKAGFYFQQALGEKRTSELYSRGRLPFFFWVIRYYLPDNPHEVRVYLGPHGQLVGYRWIPPETTSLPVSSDSPEKIALQKLSSIEDPSQWEKVEEQVQKLPGRIENHFTFEHREKYGEAGHRLFITVSGARVLNFRYGFKIPEKFTKTYHRAQNLAGLLFQGAVFLDILLVFCALFIFLKFHKLKNLDFSTGLITAAFVYLILIGAILNYMPNLVAFKYIPEKSFPIFWCSEFLSLATLSFIPAVACFLFICAGIPLSQEMGEGRKWVSFVSLSRGDIFTPQVTHSFFLGLLFAVILGGGETFFYFFAQNYFGVWVPLRSDIANSLSTLFPIFLPLSIGIGAGITEEVVFRAFGVSFFRYLGLNFKWAWILPGLAWAFAHSYEWVFPVYIRGTELLLGALVFSWFYLKSDLLAVIVAHYTYDVVAFGWPLWVSPNFSHQFWGLASFLIVLIPGLLGAFRYFKGVDPWNSFKGAYPE